MLDQGLKWLVYSLRLVGLIAIMGMTYLLVVLLYVVVT